MSSLKFSADQFTILYYIPTPGGTVADILHSAMFGNRMGPPAYEDFVASINKALQLEWVVIERDKIVMTDEGRGIVHAADATAPNSIEAQLENEDAIVGRGFEAMHTVAYELDEESYNRAVREASKFGR